MENEHESQSEEKAKNEASPEKEIQVKYELDSVQNLKKAKSNLKRSTDLKRVPIDDANIKFEVHPGIYLELKEKAKEIKQGMEFEDSELGIKVKVCYKKTTQFLKTPYGMKLQIQGLRGCSLCEIMDQAKAGFHKPGQQQRLKFPVEAGQDNYIKEICSPRA